VFFEKWVTVVRAAIQLDNRFSTPPSGRRYAVDFEGLMKKT
jgi:hypothetical protein